VTDRFKIAAKGKTWHVFVRKSAGTALDAAWVSLGGCPSQIVAMRVYMALNAREGR